MAQALPLPCNEAVVKTLAQSTRNDMAEATQTDDFKCELDAGSDMPDPALRAIASAVLKEALAAENGCPYGGDRMLLTRFIKEEMDARTKQHSWFGHYCMGHWFDCIGYATGQEASALVSQFKLRCFK